MYKTHDRLDQSRYGLLVMTAAVIIMITLTVFTISLPRDSLQMTQMMIKTLGLSTPALFPSGHALRDAAYANRAIDLRHSPHLPLVVFSPEGLLYVRLAPGQRGTP